MRKDRKAEGSDERRAAETEISGMTEKTERTGKWTDMPEETERGQFAERPETAGRNDRIEKKMSRTGYVFCGGILKGNHMSLRQTGDWCVSMAAAWSLTL